MDVLILFFRIPTAQAAPQQHAFATTAAVPRANEVKIHAPGSLKTKRSQAAIIGTTAGNPGFEQIAGSA